MKSEESTLRSVDGVQAASRPLAVLICESHLPSDGRANMFAQALKQAGFDVWGAGFERTSYTTPNTENHFDRIIAVPSPLEERKRRYLVRGALVMSSVFFNPVRMPLAVARVHCPLIGALEIAMRKEGRTPTLVVAKYWTAAAAAASLASASGAAFSYDCNELSFAEREQSALWRLTHKGLITRIEREAFAASSLSTTVGRAFADEITRYYDLSNTPLIARNLPTERPIAPKVPEEVLDFVYSGHSEPARGIDKLIRSAAFWRPGRRLILQLVGHKDHIAALSALAKECRVGDKVVFIDPEPRERLVASLSRYSVGIALFPTGTLQLKLCEPNKFYQYLFAGLPVLAAEGSALAGIIQRENVGWVCNPEDSEALAALVNGMTSREVVSKHAGLVRLSVGMDRDVELANLSRKFEEFLPRSHRLSTTGSP